MTIFIVVVDATAAVYASWLQLFDILCIFPSLRLWYRPWMM